LVQHANRDRNVLQAFFLAAGGDDDLAAAAIVGSSVAIIAVASSKARYRDFIMVSFPVRRSIKR
jgi:hypothetical protein